MKSGDIEIVNKLGLHARAASKLVNTTQSFSCDVRLRREGGDAIDAKSIMAVLMLEAVCGTVLRLSCAGDDEEEAFAAISQLIGDRFGEGE